MSIIIIIIPLIFISATPSIAIIYIVNFWLEEPKIPPKTFATLSMFSALASSIILKLELENGLFSLPFQLAALSSLWVLFFIFAFLGYKLIRKKGLYK